MKHRKPRSKEPKEKRPRLTFAQKVELAFQPVSSLGMSGREFISNYVL